MVEELSFAWMNFDDQASSGKPKSEDSKAALQAIKTNSTSKHLESIKWSVWCGSLSSWHQ